MAKGLRRLVQLIVDRKSADKVQKDTQTALKKGTDPSAAKQNLARVEGGMNRLIGLAKKMAVAFGAMWAVRKLKQFGAEMLRVAIDSNQVWTDLEGQLRNVGVEMDQVRGEIDAAARSLQDVTRFGDEDFAGVLQELVSITGDYGASMRDIETVMDVAVAKKIDLKTASQLVGRTMIGETSLLKRYGIVVQEGTDAMDSLRSRFGGMARNEATDLQGKLSQVNNEWGDFRQELGTALIQAGEGESVLDRLRLGLKAATQWVVRNKEEITFWGMGVLTTIRAITTTLLKPFQVLYNLGQAIGYFLQGAFWDFRLDLGRTINWIAERVNGLIEGLNHLPGIDIQWRMNGQDTAEFARKRQQNIDAMKREGREAVDALMDIGNAWIDLTRVAERAEQAQRRAAAAAAAPPPSSGGGGGGRVPSIDGPGANQLNPDRMVLDPNGLRLSHGHDARQARYDQLVAAEDAAMQQLEDRARQAGDQMTSAFEGFFHAALTGFDSVGGAGEALKNVVAGVGAAVVASLAEGKAEYHIAEGTGKLASGTWPPNPAAIASAGKHFAAAALFKALPAIIGSAGRGRGAGRASIASARGIGSVSRPPTHLPPRSTSFTVFVDPFNPYNPVHQSAVHVAGRQALERYGDRGGPTVLPTSAYRGT